MNTYRVSLFLGNDIPASGYIGYSYGICSDKHRAVYFSDNEGKTIKVIRKEKVDDFITEDKVGIRYPGVVCIATDGNLYFTDHFKHVICKVINGDVRVHAGIYAKKEDSDGTENTLHSPIGIVEGDEGEFYVACGGSNSIKKVSKDGTISTVCKAVQPYAMAKDYFGNLYISEFLGNCVQQVNKSGIVTSFGAAGHLERPTGIAFDMYGNLLVCEYYSGIIKQMSMDGVITVLNCVDTLGLPYVFNCPVAMAVDVTGVYVVELNRRISKIDMPFVWNTSFHHRLHFEKRTEIKAFVLTMYTKYNSQVARDILYTLIRLIATQ